MAILTWNTILLLLAAICMGYLYAHNYGAMLKELRRFSALVVLGFTLLIGVVLSLAIGNLFILLIALIIGGIHAFASYLMMGMPSRYVKN